MPLTRLKCWIYLPPMPMPYNQIRCHAILVRLPKALISALLKAEVTMTSLSHCTEPQRNHEAQKSR